VGDGNEIDTDMAKIMGVLTFPMVVFLKLVKPWHCGSN
jgi:hypothetical protein